MYNKGKLVLNIETINKLIDGQIAREKASIILNCHVKTITKMKKAYLPNPTNGLMHKNSDRNL